MNSPIYENHDDRANSEISSNFKEIQIKKFSSEEFFSSNSLDDDFFLDNKFDEFLGDSEESTEISSIISNLNSSNSCNSEKQKADSEEDSSNNEILNILKRNNENTKIIPCRLFIQKNIPNLSKAIKKISLVGRVLKSEDNTRCESKSPNIHLNFNRPERSSNPILKNNSHFFEDFDYVKM